MMRLALVWVACWCLVCGTGTGQVGGSGGSHYHMKRQGQPTHAHQHSGGGQHQHRLPKRPDTPGERPKLLNDDGIMRDKEHIKEELPEYLPLSKIEEMSDRELDFHYFRMHDTDDNLQLDGLELLAAITHVVSDDDATDDQHPPSPPQTPGKGVNKLKEQISDEDMEFFIELVDDVLDDYDTDNDGFLNWREFAFGRRKEK